MGTLELMVSPVVVDWWCVLPLCACPDTLASADSNVVVHISLLVHNKPVIGST